MMDVILFWRLPINYEVLATEEGLATKVIIELVLINLLFIILYINLILYKLTDYKNFDFATNEIIKISILRPMRL